MIGGVDIPFTGTVLDGDVDVLLRAARAAWPHAFVESGDGTFAEPIGRAVRVRWSAPAEMFVYESPEAYASWTASGLTEENADKMVAVTLEADCISFVVNDEGGTTGAIVRDMVESVRENRWLALAAPAA
jgi:hypothetical protein